MPFETYRAKATVFRQGGGVRDWRIAHWAVGLTNEAGELAGDVKKHVFRQQRSFEETRTLILDEAGDVLWYLDALCDEYNLTLEEVAEHNIAKLTQRRGAKAAA